MINKEPEYNEYDVILEPEQEEGPPRKPGLGFRKGADMNTRGRASAFLAKCLRPAATQPLSRVFDRGLGGRLRSGLSGLRSLRRPRRPVVLLSGLLLVLTAAWGLVHLVSAEPEEIAYAPPPPGPRVAMSVQTPPPPIIVQEPTHSYTLPAREEPVRAEKVKKKKNEAVASRQEKAGGTKDKASRTKEKAAAKESPTKAASAKAKDQAAPKKKATVQSAGTKDKKAGLDKHADKKKKPAIISRAEGDLVRDEMEDDQPTGPRPRLSSTSYDRPAHDPLAPKYKVEPFLRGGRDPGNFDREGAGMVSQAKVEESAAGLKVITGF